MQVMKLFKNKKVVIGLLIALAIVGGFFWWRGRSGSPTEINQKQKLTLPNNVIPVA